MANMPISFVLETNMGGVPVTLCSCGAILYQPMASNHVEQCAVAATAVALPEETPQ